ncbi:TatD family hydrolase [Kaistia geumhonensis]|uniref:TatD DNase family protein n=1 Tax=Kaistia geumhonensis TaxID=410839 RepID=A0ABU0M1A5_9HYPH|nr:TatD family hydrolase [Kaistia geumhonensis]MCX5480035.1 TatD family hydrolase [Kaistia geumhonensis]MDQ0514737.1 TatD DNase family protein [Kaistia geumhonensis]
MLVDSHCHLDFSDFDQDRDRLIADAHAAGVGLMVTISTRVRRFDQIRAIAERYPSVFCSIGTHPNSAHEEPDVTTGELVALSQHPKVVAIGEAGLDYVYGAEHKALQAEGLRRHIAAARITGLPLVIHARDADDDMIAIIEEESRSGAFPAILHCFSSGRRLAEVGIALGFYVSFSGILTFRSAESLRDIARDLPADRLLVETDAPYLAPVPHRGQRNQPAFVRETAAVLADVRGVSLDEIARVTTENVRRLFTKIPASAFEEADADV